MENPIQAMLEQKVWAVLGVSRDTGKFGYKVYKRLLDKGYTVYAINPNMTELEGQKVYASLKELPEVPQVVNFVVPPGVTRTAVEEAKELGVGYLWMQPGSADPKAIKSAEKAGLVVISNQCVLQLA